MKSTMAWLLALACQGAFGQDYQMHGFLDLRLAVAPQQRSWTDGGLGKTRYGDGGAQASLASAAVIGTAQISPALFGYADIQFHNDDRGSLDLVEAYMRYRPVSLTPWRWSLKAGAFFPPISLENDAIGWTSPWTLTPSAINSWVGEELRGLGAELRVERRAERGTLEASIAAFGYNDPAGEILAARGWSLSDVTSGFGGQLREPDVYALGEEVAPPLRYKPYVELDRRPGWYAQLGWRSPEFGDLTALHYDNRADPTRSSTYDGHTTFAWRTRFSSLGARTRIGEVELIAQAMDGATTIQPVPNFRSETEFHAGYLLAGWTRGEWRPALRVDFFSMRQIPGGPLPLSEHGNSLTAALVWRPLPWLRVTGEVLRVNSWRIQRLLEQITPRAVDTQFQVSARLLF
ncbi:MAG: hypothetical protein ABI411_10590 [Tahibacter sp.]